MNFAGSMSQAAGSAAGGSAVSCTSTCSVFAACSPFLWGGFVDGVSITGTLVLVALSFCWCFFALRCRDCRLRGGVSDHQHTLSRLPALSVITPIKGVHVDSLDNWRSVLDTEYNGDIEFIFVVESSDDPAYLPLKQLQSEVVASCSKNLQGVKVAVAGMGFHCSQKIHNMLEGVSLVNRKSKYVLFLDDDVALYRNTFRDLVMEMENDDKVFVATGFPYDWLHTKFVPFPSYLKLVYRWTSLLLLWNSRVPVVWGGCMLIRREDVHSNRYGMMQAWRDRGYSDDMIVGSVCVKEKRTIALAPTCIFPHKLGSHDTMANYWNFACRQMFVLDTYHNKTERMQNYILLFFVSTFLPLVCVAQFITTLLRTIAYSCLFFSSELAQAATAAAATTASSASSSPSVASLAGAVGASAVRAVVESPSEAARAAAEMAIAAPAYLGQAAAAFVGTVGEAAAGAAANVLNGNNMLIVEQVVARGAESIASAAGSTLVDAAAAAISGAASGAPSAGAAGAAAAAAGSAAAAAAAVAGGCDPGCMFVATSAPVYVLVSAWLAYFFIALSVRWTAVEALSLCNYLLPSRNQVPVVMPSLWRCILAFLVHHLLLPCAAVFGFVSNSVTWSNVTYKVQQGRISEVSRRTPEGELITMPWQQSLAEAAERHKSRGFLEGVAVGHAHGGHAGEEEGNL